MSASCRKRPVTWLVFTTILVVGVTGVVLAKKPVPPPPTPSPPVAYQAVWFEPVDPPPEVTAVLGTGSALYDINDSFTAVGRAHWYDGQMWHLRAAIAFVKYSQEGVPYLESHRLEELTQSLPTGQCFTSANLINNAGIVAGHVEGDGAFGAYVCDTSATPYTVQYLAPGFDIGRYQRMNEHGDLTLLGPAAGGQGSNWVAVPPYEYGGVDDPNDDFYRLPPEVHDAYGINDNLQVVALDSTTGRVCVYQLDLMSGTFTRTAVLDANAGMSQGQINRNGVIAHWTRYYYRKNTWRAVVAWTGAPYTITEPLTTIRSNPQDINNSAQICGYANDLHRGFIFHPAKGFWILDDLVFPKNDVAWFDPLSHSNDGHALTSAFFPVTEGDVVHYYPAICGERQYSGADSAITARGYVLLPLSP